MLVGFARTTFLMEGYVSDDILRSLREGLRKEGTTPYCGIAHLDISGVGRYYSSFPICMICMV